MRGKLRPDRPAGAGSDDGRIDAAVVEHYLGHLERAESAPARRLAIELLDAGCSVADVLVDLVAVAQREVGRRWLTGHWSVAQEHAATHVSEQVLDAVARRIPRRGDRGQVVMACVEGEWHALAARIVAEVVRAEGWQMTFLGASVPPRHLVSYLHQTGPDAVLLSCVQPSRLVRAARMIEACRTAGVPVVAGGPGFGPDGRWSAAVGAPVWGATARDAARLLSWRSLASMDVTAPRPTGDEHVAVLRRRREVVQLAVGVVSRDGTDADPLAALVAQLVDALAAAILVHDPELLVEFTGWQRTALAAQGSPVQLLDTVLDTCATAFAEHPQASRYLLLAGRAPAPGPAHR